MTSPPQNKLIKLLLRATVSILIVLLLLWWLPIDTLFESIVSIPSLTWIIVFSGFITGHIASAFKWRLLLSGVNVNIHSTEAIKAHGAGLFANLCLPSVVGGDIVRAGWVIRHHGQVEAITLGSFADRLNDTVALVMITAVASLFVPESREMDVGYILTFVGVLLLVGILAGILFIRFIPIHYLPHFLQNVVSKSRVALISLFKAPAISLACFFLSLTIQSSFIGLNILIAEAIGISISIYLWFFVWPLAKLIALAPISLGGLGVREATLAALLVPFGVDSALAVAQGLSWQAVLICSGLFSGLIVALLTRGEYRCA